MPPSFVSPEKTRGGVLKHLPTGARVKPVSNVARIANFSAKNKRFLTLDKFTEKNVGLKAPLFSIHVHLSMQYLYCLPYRASILIPMPFDC